MKRTFKLMSLTLCTGFIMLVSCKKDDDKNKKDDSNGSDCYTCQNCEGQYGHMLNREYCVDGFDNRQDWLDMKATYESAPNNCDCEFN